MDHINKIVADFEICQGEIVENHFARSVFVYCPDRRFPWYKVVPRLGHEMEPSEFIYPAPTFDEICIAMREYDFSLDITCANGLNFELVMKLHGQSSPMTLFAVNEKPASGALYLLIEGVRRNANPLRQKEFEKYRSSKMYCCVCGRQIQYNYFFGNPGSKADGCRVCEECAVKYPETGRNSEFQFVTHYLNGY